LKYKYLVIEGNIGAGKTSLASLLAEETNSRLVLEAFSDNPFLAKFYEEPGRYAFQLELSFLFDRYHRIRLSWDIPISSANLLSATIILLSHLYSANTI